jgi:hypothetical protein
MERKLVVQKDDRREAIGIVDLTLPTKKPSVLLDLAITPVLRVGPGEPLKLDEFLMSPRTQLDIRPREEAAPFNHIGCFIPDIWPAEVEALLELVKGAEDLEADVRLSLKTKLESALGKRP